MEANVQTYLTTSRPQFSSFQVCQNDILVVDVENKIPGHSLSVHWRGQPQNEVPFMDGVPMITQCPISSYTTFQYKFRASAPGTHLWQAHSNSDIDHGIFGALIVRQSDKIDPHKKLYDIDSKHHVILISEWSNPVNNQEDDTEPPKFVFINGKSIHGGSLESYKISKGKRYRFRIAYAGSVNNCPITLKIDRHLIKIIAIDGNPVTPYEVTSVTLTKGERVDVVLKAKQNSGSYYVRVESNCGRESSEGLAVIEYESERTEDDVEIGMDDGEGRNLDTGRCDASLGRICIEDLHSLKKMPKELRRNVDQTVYLAYDHAIISTRKGKWFVCSSNRLITLISC